LLGPLMSMTDRGNTH